MSKCETIKTFNGEVYFRGISFSSINDIKRQIEDEEKFQTDMRNKLVIIGMSTPKDITPGGSTPLDYVTGQVNDILDDLEDSYQKWNLLVFALHIFQDWTFKEPGMSIEDAFKEAYVDRYADLRKEINKK